MKLVAVLQKLLSNHPIYSLPLSCWGGKWQGSLVSTWQPSRANPYKSIQFEESCWSKPMCQTNLLGFLQGGDCIHGWDPQYRKDTDLLEWFQSRAKKWSEIWSSGRKNILSEKNSQWVHTSDSSNKINTPLPPVLCNILERSSHWYRKLAWGKGW